MIKHIHKLLIAFICSITLSICAVAQELYPTQPQGIKDCETGDFTALSATGNFEITLEEGPCAVRLQADDALLPYIVVSVKDSVLFIEYDEKAVPKEVKKIYRGRNAPIPFMKASVSSPFLNGITASQNAVISGNGTLVADSIEITLTDKARVKDLKVEANYALLRLNKNCQATMNVDSASQLELSLDGSSLLKLQYKTRNLLMYQVGNASCILNGDCSTATFSIGGSAQCRSAHKGNVMVLEAGGTADIKLTGEMGDLTLKADRMAKMDCLEMKTMRVKANLTGWTHAYVNAQEFLSVDLSGSSALYYTGIPAIQVGKIVKSTFAPYEEPQQQ